MAQMRRIPSTGPEKADRYKVPVWYSSQLKFQYDESRSEESDSRRGIEIAERCDLGCDSPPGSVQVQSMSG